MITIQIQDLYYKPTIEFFNIEILDKTFSGIKRGPNVYVIKTSSRFNNEDDIEFEWKSIRYQLYGIYEHLTNHIEWRIIECRRWHESRV